MRKLRANVEKIASVMVVALLLCVFLCPVADACEMSHCPDSSQEIGHLDSHNDHHHHGAHHPHCELDVAHPHEFFSNTTSIMVQQVEKVVFDYIVQLFEKSDYQRTYLDSIARDSRHTFTVRRLNKIILRV
ncbi:hypothetical protein P4E94_01920 [Pontiellaceae bacterium B12219]|nr:hypothetical protein [Pontiellaceae bacterium B12219]